MGQPTPQQPRSSDAHPPSHSNSTAQLRRAASVAASVSQPPPRSPPFHSSTFQGVGEGVQPTEAESTPANAPTATQPPPCSSDAQLRNGASTQPPVQQLRRAATTPPTHPPTRAHLALFLITFGNTLN